ncbi:MAG: alpha/beta hydrolase family protein, partial [Phycicoccus sp.]
DGNTHIGSPARCACCRLSTGAVAVGSSVGSDDDLDPAENLPRFAGPTLILHGENEIQTPVRGAFITDEGLEPAGNRDHTLKAYPGIGHGMNLTPKWTGDFGDPDPAVVRDIAAWFAERAR